MPLICIEQVCCSSEDENKDKERIIQLLLDNKAKRTWRKSNIQSFSGHVHGNMFDTLTTQQAGL